MKTYFNDNQDAFQFAKSILPDFLKRDNAYTEKNVKVLAVCIDDPFTSVVLKHDKQTFIGVTKRNTYKNPDPVNEEIAVRQAMKRAVDNIITFWYPSGSKNWIE